MTETYADKAERVTAELRTAVGAAHAAMKDMRSLLKEIRETRAKWEDKIEHQIKETFGELLSDHLTAYGDQLNTASTEATKKMYVRFDKIMAILMGEEKGEEETMDDLARKVKAAMDAGPPPPAPLRKKS